MKAISISEELTLLALDDESGRWMPLPDRSLDYALAGALLHDLRAMEVLRIGEKSVELRQVAPDLKGAWAHAFNLCQPELPFSLVKALTLLAGEAESLKKEITSTLVDKGILEENEKEIFWIFHRHRYPLLDASRESAVKERLRNILLDESVEVSGHDRVLLSLVYTCQLGPIILDEDSLKKVSARFSQIAEESKIGHAVSECINEIHRAIMEIRMYTGF